MHGNCVELQGLSNDTVRLRVNLDSTDADLGVLHLQSILRHAHFIRYLSNGITGSIKSSASPCCHSAQQIAVVIPAPFADDHQSLAHIIHASLFNP
jgi:hypothetical protein